MLRDALVVGINAYQRLPSLQAPAHDAEAIAHHLQTHGEFRVQRLPEIIQSGHPQVGVKTRVNLRQLETALVNLFKPKGSNVPHTALFYFSGHGIQKDAGVQEGYLALSDADPDQGFYGLSLFWLRRLLQDSPVRQRIVLLDCCHSGELLNFLEADPGARSGTDRLFMAASREYEAAYESLDSSYSVFTGALLSGLDPQASETGIVTNHSLTAAVNARLRGELQQPLFESSGSEIVLTRSGRSHLPTTARPSSAVCPYRGLSFFDEADAEYFFGRETLTDQLIEKLRSRRFVAVVGASGSGKSSLVRAGLISKLRQGRSFSGSDRWRVKLLTPGEHPVKSLAAAFVDLAAADLDRAEQLQRAEAFLQTGGVGLAQLARASLLSETPTTGLLPSQRPHLLLVIDQFEESFTFAQTEQERQQFFDCLTGAIEAAEGCLSVLVALRADFLGKCSLHEPLAQQIEANLMLVTPLSYEQIKSTIVCPAQKVGLVCEPNLVYTMLLDVIGAPGELPLLQYTLMELWQERQIDPDTGETRLTLDTYTALGGVRGTLQKRASEIFYGLMPDEQEVAKRVFLALTQLGEGTEDTRRRVLKSELISPSLPADLVDRTIEKLVAAKLIVTSRVEDCFASGGTEARSTPTSNCHEAIDVVHEALIRNWSLLRNWLDESRDRLRRQRRIEQAAQEWDWAGQIVAAEYLLYGGRLVEAEDFWSSYPNELSALAQQYISVSRAEAQRVRRAARRLQVALPTVLTVIVMVVVQQARRIDPQPLASGVLRQLIAAVPSAPPHTTALLPPSPTDDRAAQPCQPLRLQVKLEGERESLQEIWIHPNQRYVIKANPSGALQLQSLQPPECPP